MSRGRLHIGAASFLAVVAVSLRGSPIPPTPVPTPASLTVSQPNFVSGKPFPPVTPLASTLPAEKRTVFVAAEAPPGDGSEARPWNDLQAALRALSPGDRLRVRAGRYAGSFRVDESCRDGTKSAPIQVVFDGKAVIESESEGFVLTLARSHWRIVGGYLNLEDTPASGVSIEGPSSHDLTLDGLRVSGGRGPSIRIGPEAARIAVLRGNLAKSPLTVAAPSAFGIEIAAGADDVRIEQNRLHENPAGSIRVGPPAPGGRPARHLRIAGNRIYDDGATAIEVAAADDLTIQDNILSDRTTELDTRALVLTRVSRGVVRSNRVSNYGVAIHVGHAEPDGSGAIAGESLTIARNLLETSRPGGTALVVEAANGLVVANNVVGGYASGILVFGRPPQTRNVTVANNLLLGVSDVAFLLGDPAAATLFDYNVFSPAGPALVEIGGASTPLARLLKEGKMPHSQVKPGVRILYGDLARVSGVPTVDRGKAVAGVPFRGSAPDIGVAER
jgi:Right handed beta helix region